MSDFIGGLVNFLGVVGVILVLTAYILIQTNRMSSATVSFSFLNTLGSFLILISLCFYWNLASGIIEGAWLIISLYGLVKAIKNRRKLRGVDFEN